MCVCVVGVGFEVCVVVYETVFVVCCDMDVLVCVLLLLFHILFSPSL